jgi:hypothetical protein
MVMYRKVPNIVNRRITEPAITRTLILWIKGRLILPLKGKVHATYRPGFTPFGSNESRGFSRVQTTKGAVLTSKNRPPPDNMP